MKRLHTVFHCPLLCCLAAAAAQASTLSAATLPLSEPREWSFAVYLDERPIGSHDFVLRQDGELLKLQTEANFEVKILFFTAYTYSHRNIERWDGRGLLSIEAYTDANGKIHDLRGQRADDGFKLKVDGNEEVLPATLKTFAYWNPAILEESRLLNSQTGEYEPVEVVMQGQETVEFRGRQIPAIRYDLNLENGASISLWYSPGDKTWLALESTTESGRRLIYKPVRLPESPVELAGAQNP